MKILVACEESQRICISFRERGHEAYSCDVQEPSGGHFEWHIQGDCIPLLNGNCTFVDVGGGTHSIDGTWDMLIAFPPCTHLAVSGARWFPEKRADGRQQRAIEFFMMMVNADCPKIAVENPVGIMSKEYRKPDQIVQPYWFGDHARKSTCLWLKNLPKLTPTDMVDPGPIVGEGYSVNASLNYARDERGRILPWNDPRTAKARSKTFWGLARAMAESWG